MTANPTKTRRTRQFAGVLVGAALLAASACGSDDDAALSDEEFCERMEQLEEEFEEDADDDLDAEALAALADLAASAPNEQVGDALRTFGEALSIVFDPEFTGAFETLERYLVDTCGYDESEFSGGFDDDVLDDGATSGGSTDTDEAAPDTAPGTESEIAYDEEAYERVFDDLSLLRDPVEADLGTVQGIGVMSMMGPPVATIDVDPAEVDPMEACRVLASVWDDLLSSSGLPVEVNEAGSGLVVARPEGGDCAPA